MIHQFHRYMVMSGEGLADEHRVRIWSGTSDQRWSPSREYIGMSSMGVGSPTWMLLRTCRGIGGFYNAIRRSGSTRSAGHHLPVSAWPTEC